MDRPRRPTSADVAARAGVSRSTVSYVLSGSTQHSFPQATRDRVLLAASELGYTPHAAARALRRGTSGVVLLVLADVPIGANLGSMLAEMTTAVAATGRSLVTWTGGVGPTLRETLAHLDPVVVLTMAPLAPAEADAVGNAGIPLVAMPYAGSATQTVGPAAPSRGELQVGALQLQHLAAHGHRRVAVLTVAEPRLALFAHGRVEGVRRAALDLGLDQPPVLALGEPDDTAVEEVAGALTGWVRGPAPVTALCCYNDLYAAVALAAAARCGLRVPQDLSVAGIDDDPLGRFLAPPLTTIRFDFRDTARAVVEQVAAVLEGAPLPPPGPSSQVLRVVERASVGPPPAR